MTLNEQQPLTSATKHQHVKSSEIKAIPTFALGDQVDVSPVQAYLKHYGYIAAESETPTGDQVGIQTISALKSFQEFHNIQVDGVFGNETRTAMTATRCALPDINSVAADVGFAVVGPWKDRNIRYTFGPMSRQLDAEACRAAFRRAIRTWANAGVGLTFTEVANNDNPEVYVDFRAAADPDYNMVGGVLAHADFPPPYSVVVTTLPLPVHFDDTEHTWVDGAVANGYDIETVALHEFGHILGLAHTNIAGAVMAPTVSANFTLRNLTTDDVSSIRNAYPAWRSVGSRYTGIPAVVSWAEGRIDVFVRGDDNSVYHKYQNGQGTDFLPAGAGEKLGGIVSSNVTAVSFAPNRIDLFALGADNACHHKWWDGTAWRGWESLGGLIIGEIEAVSWGNQRLDLFARGMDNGVYHRAWSPQGWYPANGWENLGGKIVGAPKAVCWGPNRIDIFVRGTDNGVYQKTWNGSAWLPSPTSWKGLGGVILDDITCISRRVNHLDLFARGTNNTLHQKTWNGSVWQPSETAWQNLGGVLMSRPSAVAWGSDRLYIAAQGINNDVQVKEWDGRAWIDWTSLGGVITDAPVVDPRGGDRMAVYVRAADATSYVFD